MRKVLNLIPEISFGTASVAGLFQRVDHSFAVDVIKNVLTKTLYADTALHYGAGDALVRLGVAMGENPEQYSISFKVGHILTETNADNLVNPCGFVDAGMYNRHFDYSSDGILRAFNQSLNFLNKGRKLIGLKEVTPGENLKIAAVFIHDVDEVPHLLRQALDEAMPTLADLHKKGLIGGYGFGVKAIEPIRQALQYTDANIHISAGRFTLLENGSPKMPEEMKQRHDNASQVIQEATKKGVGIIVASPSNSGLAFGEGKYEYSDISEEVGIHYLAFVKALKNIGVTSKEDILALTIQFPIAFGNGNISVMTGPRTCEHVESALGAYRKTTFGKDNVTLQNVFSSLQENSLLNSILEIPRFLQSSSAEAITPSGRYFS